MYGFSGYVCIHNKVTNFSPYQASPNCSSMIGTNGNSGFMIKDKKKDMKKKTVTVTAVLLEKFQENVPKKSGRAVLQWEKKIKKLFVSRTDTHNDLDERIRWVFGVNKYTFLECIKGGNKLIISSNQHMDGLDAIHRRGSLYLCKEIDKVCINYFTIAKYMIVEWA